MTASRSCSTVVFFQILHKLRIGVRWCRFLSCAFFLVSLSLSSGWGCCHFIIWSTRHMVLRLVSMHNHLACGSFCRPVWLHSLAYCFKLAVWEKRSNTGFPDTNLHFMMLRSLIFGLTMKTAKYSSRRRNWNIELLQKHQNVVDILSKTQMPYIMQ